MKRQHKVNFGWQRPEEQISEAYQRQIDRSTEKAEVRWRRAQKAAERAQRAAERAGRRAEQKPTRQALAAREEAQRLVALRLAELREVEGLMRAPTHAPTTVVHRTGRQDRLEVGEYRRPARKRTPMSPVKTRRKP